MIIWKRTHDESGEQLVVQMEESSIALAKIFLDRYVMRIGPRTNDRRHIPSFVLFTVIRFSSLHFLLLSAILLTYLP